MPRINGALAQRCFFLGILVPAIGVVGSANAGPPPSSVVAVVTKYDFPTLVTRVESAIAGNQMLLVAKASASASAEKRGVKIPGDMVLMVFRGDYAVRMLHASQRAGIEAPIPVHVFELPDGRAGVAYRRPTVAFRPYGDNGLNEMAKELDVVFDRITQQAVGDGVITGQP